MQKFSSNVIEKILEKSTVEMINKIIQEISLSSKILGIIII